MGTSSNEERVRGNTSVTQGDGFSRRAENLVSRTDHNARAPVGVYEATVMNDEDLQYMGRVWCYVYGISETMDLNETPDAIGDAGQPLHDLEGTRSRHGWMRFLPVLPFVGSNDYRNTGEPRDGFSTSYGLWGQPRTGDRLLVVFSQSRFAEGFYIGGIPKPGQTAQLPGAPVDNIDDEEFRLVGTELPLNGEAGDRRVPYSIDDNLKAAGLQQDYIRGGSSSGARRESPSRVYGIKTPGNWQDVRQGDQQAVGHQLVLDDLPANQLARLRSSRGNQVVLGDAARCIYINTALGNSYIEMSEAGRIDIYAADSISIHTEDDINLRAGRDLNIDVERDINIRAKGKFLTEISGDWDLRVDGNMKERIQGTYDAYAVGDHKTYTGAEYHVLSSSNLFVQSGALSNYTGTGRINVNSAADTYIQSGGSPATQAVEAAEVNTANQPGVPTRDQISAGEGGDDFEYVANQDGQFRVPQHEPWSPGDRYYGEFFPPAPPRGTQNAAPGGNSATPPGQPSTRGGGRPGPLEIEDVTQIVIHCSATKPSGNIGADTIHQWHQNRGWSGCGYHVVIQRDGTVQSNDGTFGPPGKQSAQSFMRTTDTRGAHVSGQNSVSIGVCLVGGLHDSETNAAGHSLHYPDYTDEQNASLQAVIEQLQRRFHNARNVIGHNNIPDAGKDCPCFDVLYWNSTNQFRAKVSQGGNPYADQVIPTHPYNPPVAY